MTLHRIDLQSDKRKFGGDTMLLNGKAIGKSEKPLYDASRWLLDNNAADPADMVETYRGETLSMHGIVGELANWTVAETKSGKPSLQLRRWEAFQGLRVGSPAAETLPGVDRRRCGRGGRMTLRINARAATALHPLDASLRRLEAARATHIHALAGVFETE
jgi:hypothetical protein